MWDLPGPGFEPASPALSGGFLTTVPPGKPVIQYFYRLYSIKSYYKMIAIIPDVVQYILVAYHKGFVFKGSRSTGD